MKPDHCTGWLEGWWAEACRLHDLAYEANVDRWAADLALFSDVAASMPAWAADNPALAAIASAASLGMGALMWAGVRVFGGRFHRAARRMTLPTPSPTTAPARRLFFARSTAMRMSNQGLAELAGHEGIVTSRYKDSVGVWTIGVGHTAAAGDPDPATSKAEWEVDDLLDLFRRDVQSYEREVLRSVKVPLTQTQFDALVSFHYNTGGISRAKLTQALNRGDYAGAANGFMGWVRPAEIRGRREKEQRLFRDGVYSNGGMATVWSATPSGSVEWGKGERVNALALLGAEEASVPIPTPRPGTLTRPPVIIEEAAVPVPDLTPIEQMNKPVQGAKAGFGVTTATGAMLYLWSTTVYFPAAWATDPQATIALTIVASGFTGLVANFVASYWARDKRFVPETPR